MGLTSSLLLRMRQHLAWNSVHVDAVLVHGRGHPDVAGHVSMSAAAMLLECAGTMSAKRKFERTAPSEGFEESSVGADVEAAHGGEGLVPGLAVVAAVVARQHLKLIDEHDGDLVVHVQEFDGHVAVSSRCFLSAT